MTEPRTWTIKRKRGVGGHAQVAGPDCDWVRVVEVGPALVKAITDAQEASPDDAFWVEKFVARLSGED